MAAAAASLIQAAQAQEGLLEVVTPAIPAPAEATYFDAEGTAQTVAALKGKVVVLHFWAKWCPPCVVELPEFREAAEALQSDSVVFLPLSLDADPATVALYFSQNTIALPVYMDRQGAIMRAFGMKGLPSTVILDKDGHVIARRNGVVDWKHVKTRAIISGAANPLLPKNKTQK